MVQPGHGVYYSAIKEGGEGEEKGEEEEGKLIDKITQMNLQRAMLSEKSPFRKVTYYTIPFIERS